MSYKSIKKIIPCCKHCFTKTSKFWIGYTENKQQKHPLNLRQMKKFTNFKNVK